MPDPQSPPPPSSSPSTATQPGDPIDLATSVAGEEDPGASIDLATVPSPGAAVPADSPGTGEAICPRCGGSGKLGASACPACAGSGKANVGIGGA